MFEERGLFQKKPNFWDEKPFVFQPISALGIAADKFDKTSEGPKTLRTKGGSPIKVEIEEATGIWKVIFPFEDYTVKLSDLKDTQSELKRKIAEVSKNLIGENDRITIISLLKNGSQVNVLGLKPKDAS